MASTLNPSRPAAWPASPLSHVWKALGFVALVAAAVATVVRASGERIAGLHRDRRVVARGAIDRADQRQLVEHACLERKMLAHPDAGKARRDGLIRPADLGRSVGLGIPGVQLGRAADQVNQQNLGMRSRGTAGKQS